MLDFTGAKNLGRIFLVGTPAPESRKGAPNWWGGGGAGALERLNAGPRPGCRARAAVQRTAHNSQYVKP